MCMEGPHRVIRVFPDGMATTRDLSGHDSLTCIMDAASGIEAGDHVAVAYGCIMEKIDPIVAEQAIALMAGAGSDGRFVLESALGDDAYQPEVAANDVAAVFPGQAVLTFG